MALVAVERGVLGVEPCCSLEVDGMYDAALLLIPTLCLWTPLHLFRFLSVNSYPLIVMATLFPLFNLSSQRAKINLALNLMQVTMKSWMGK